MAGISKVKYNTKKGIVEKYTVTYRDIYGKQHSKGMYDTKREAKKHLNEFNNIHPDILDITFEDIFRPFLEYAKRILIDKQFTKGKLRPFPKGHSQYRYVYLTDDVIEVLEERIKKIADDRMLVFPNKVGNYISDKNFRERVWKPLLIYAEIKDRVRLHDLRGTYADIALSRGASIKFVQNQLGHAKSQTTLDVYARNNTDMIGRALEGMNGVLRNE